MSAETCPCGVSHIDVEAESQPVGARIRCFFCDRNLIVKEEDAMINGVPGKLKGWGIADDC